MLTKRSLKLFENLACELTLKILCVAKTRDIFSRLWFLILFMAAAFAATARAQSYYLVDCSGTNPSALPSIGSALAVAGPGSYVIVTGTCNENVNISNAWNLNVGAPYGQTAAINGGMSVTASNSVFLYGLNVTNPGGNAFNITSSHNITLWTCTGNESRGVGLGVNSLSDVTVDGPGSFNDNGSSGISVDSNSILNVFAWGGPVDINGNHGAGVGVNNGSLFGIYGNATIENNINIPGGPRPDGFGIQAVSASIVQIANCNGTSQISGNQSGGIDVREHSRLSIWYCGTSGDNLVKDNGPVGLNVGMGSEVALYDNVVISGHTGPGIELWAQGQLYMYGPNLITNNGNASDPRSAGIVLDGNSEAFLRGGTLSSNQGPGILALVNSSVDSVGATFPGNTGGIITCDSSAFIVSDLIPATGDPTPGIACRSPHHLSGHRGSSAVPAAPDMTAQKNRAAQYKAFARPR